LIVPIKHHPDEGLLAAFAAGRLDLGQHVAIATHLVSCTNCSSFIRWMEHVGGAVLMALPPSAMAGDAFARVEARLNDPPNAATTTVVTADINIGRLPKFVRRYQFGDWRWIAPRVYLRPIELPRPSATKVFLLKAGPKTAILHHSHTGIEMTCVLSGAFRHDGGHFDPGNFDIADDTVDHEPVVDDGGDCICLVAIQGGLRLNGVIGRLFQPFLRL
jgi:putative transcriptional regulator